MDIDPGALRLLQYLGKRTTAVVGNNAPLIASALGLSVPDLVRAAQTLPSAGLATEEPMASLTRRWAITDAGLALLHAADKGAGPKRPWRRP